MPVNLRLIFAGTPDFALPALEAVNDCGHCLAAVYTQPDKPAGRGRRARASPVKQRARALGLPVYQPASLRESDAVAELRVLQADLMIVVAYGLLLPPPVLALPRYGCVNVHASLLPRWRGAAPIQRAILNGDSVTGVSVMQMAAGLDSGDVLARVECPIDPDDTAGVVHDRLAALGAQALRRLLPQLTAGTLRATPQDDQAATYAAKIDKFEARIDWRLPADEIDRRIRGYNPVPGAWTELNGDRVKLWRARVDSQPGRRFGQPGEVIEAGDDAIVVAAGSGVVCLTTLQWPGRRALSAASVVNGRDFAGARFE